MELFSTWAFTWNYSPVWTPYASLTIILHDRTATSFHQGFLWLCPAQAYVTIFLVHAHVRWLLADLLWVTPSSWRLWPPRQKMQLGGLQCLTQRLPHRSPLSQSPRHAVRSLSYAACGTRPPRMFPNRHRQQPIHGLLRQVQQVSEGTPSQPQHTETCPTSRG